MRSSKFAWRLIDLIKNRMFKSKDKEDKPGWFKKISQKIAQGLNRSATKLSTSIGQIFTHKKLDQKALKQLEDILIQSDLGVKTAKEVVSAIAKQKFDKAIEPEEVQQFCAEYISTQIAPYAKTLTIDSSAEKPVVILVVGVNGSGKTTTIAKLGHNLAKQGHKVRLVAGDTFRAAASEQLNTWAERLDLPIVLSKNGSDSAGLVFDALALATKESDDIVIIDTAGRLHTRDDLMGELSKIERVIKRHNAAAPHYTLLVLDANIGQNAESQLRTFLRTISINGLILTKLDSTAKGGVLVSLIEQFKIPVYSIGVGEGVDDLSDFDALAFANGLFNV